MKRLVPLMLVAALLSSPALGVTLADPLTGQAVEIEPGDGLLHLVFFATWCPTCVDELSRLAALEARWKRQGYRLVIVAIQTRHTRERIRDFVAEEQPPGRVLFDAKRHEWRTFSATGSIREARPDLANC